MATGTIGTNTGFIDKRIGRLNTSTTVLAEEANYGNVEAMKTRLTAISSARYPVSKLATMTENDLVYALRIETGDAAGIK
jgi:hypothetical protein